MDQSTMKKTIAELISAFKAGGKEHAQALFMQRTEGLKLFEVVVLREQAHKAFKEAGLVK